MAETVEYKTKDDLYYPVATSEDYDFVEFSFGGRKASEFNIKRTSDGSRFNENLLPTIQDKTVQVPGGDGTYYFGSFYTQRQFSIPIAFDSMTETNLFEMRQWLGDKKIKELVFQEAPYKIYKAKCTGTATIKHICFVEKGERVYKGEGTLQFTAYYPFARTPNGRQKHLDYYYIYPTKDEWAATSGLLTEAAAANFDNLLVDTGVSLIKVYNPGNLETDFKLYIPFDASGKISATTIQLYYNSKVSGGDAGPLLKLDDIERIGTDAKIRINSATNLIEGVDAKGALTGSVYNRYVATGEFFKIPVTREINDPYCIRIDGGSDYSGVTIEYDYLYF